MSQYFVVCNPKKRQVLRPSAFGDGVQLCSLDLTLSALALLTSNGNGRGNGDFAIPYDHDIHGPPPGYTTWFEAEAAGLGPQPSMTPLPEFRLAGSWAGDPIVTVGDYCDPRKWCTKLDMENARIRLEHETIVGLREAGKPFDTKELDMLKVRKKNLGLYFVATRFYEDVSDEVVRMFGLCGVGPMAKADPEYDWIKDIHDWLKADVYNEFCDGKQKARLHPTTKQWTTQHDLRHLPINRLDSLIRIHADSPERLKSLKAWLRKQQITPMVRELLACYHPCVNGEERHHFAKIRRIFMKYDYPIDEPERKKQLERLLPPTPLLHAAIAAGRLMDVDPETDRQTYAERIADALHEIIIAGKPKTDEKPSREQRAIDLTKAGT
jgi:hypothetical protein